MSALVTSNPDNANPTVYSRPSGGSRRLADFLDEDMFLPREGASSSDGEGDHPQMIWSSPRDGSDASSDDDDEPIDQQEIFGERCNSQEWWSRPHAYHCHPLDLIRSITDPEHPLTLEQLAVVNAEHITITHGSRPSVKVVFTPTIPHCSMATLIGLCIRVRLLRSLPDRFKVDIRVKEGSHESENSRRWQGSACLNIR